MKKPIDEMTREELIDEPILANDENQILQAELDERSKALNLAFVSKRFIVMYEDGHYYGSFSPLGVWETYDSAEIAENKWKQENPSKQTCIEEVDYNAC
jgi:hypothetical protein